MNGVGVAGGRDDPRPDAALLRAHVDGDREAFGILFARHRDRLWAVALRTMGNPEDAADGLQDGLVAAYRRASSYRGEAAVTTWLHRVVVNACLDKMRSQRLRTHTQLTPALHEQVTLRDHFYQDPAYAIIVAEALAELPGDQRDAVVVVDMLRCTVAEASHRLRFAAGNFYVNDKPTGAVVGQQPFGGGRASGTNDKAGSAQNLLRWTSPRSIKETFVPPKDHAYPHMG